MVRTTFSAALLSLAATVVEAAAFNCTWSDPLVLLEETRGGISLEHYRNPDIGTLTLRVTSHGEWIGIGINLEGNDWMAPAVAVIGRMEDDVGWYEIVNDAKDGSGVSELVSELPQDASFQRDASTATLQFTMPLNGTLYSISDNSTWIYAAGDLSENWAESQFGSFRMTLQDRCTPVATNGFKQGEEDGPLQSDQSVQGNNTGESEPSNGPLPPRPSSSVGSSQSFTIHEIAWKVHQWMMVVAWGVAAPLAIGASLLRKLFPSPSEDESRSQPIWYRCHLVFGASCLALTVLGMFVLALVPVVSDPNIQLVLQDNESFQNHRWIGYSLLLALLANTAASACQFGLAYVPPPLPPGQIVNDVETEATVNANESESSTTGVPGEPTEWERNSQQEENERAATARVQVSLPSQTMVAMGPDETDCRGPNALTTGRGTANKVLVHRLVGVVLLGLAWCACQTGYVFLGETSWIFWMFVSIISASVLLAMAIQNEGERLPGDY